LPPAIRHSKYLTTITIALIPENAVVVVEHLDCFFECDAVRCQLISIEIVLEI